MKRGIVIADYGPIISLALVDKLWILEELFEEILIPEAVWHEITFDPNKAFVPLFKNFFRNRVLKISGFNELSMIMDYGESEAVILYKQINAKFLIVDDKKARKIAENFGVNCIGTIGLLGISKVKKIIPELKPVFKAFLQNNRYYSIDLLNHVLQANGEKPL